MYRLSFLHSFNPATILQHLLQPIGRIWYNKLKLKQLELEIECNAMGKIQ